MLIRIAIAITRPCGKTAANDYAQHAKSEQGQRRTFRHLRSAIASQNGAGRCDSEQQRKQTGEFFAHKNVNAIIVPRNETGGIIRFHVVNQEGKCQALVKPADAQPLADSPAARKAACASAME